jgi:hypothetical protein
MPKKADNAAVETEKGFGTGLRTKLEKRRPGPAEPVEAVEAAATEAEPELEPEAEAAVEEQPELSETEQLWAELEESLAREEALKLQLAEQTKAYEETRELGRRLAERAEVLQRREEELAVQFEAAKARRPDEKSSEPGNGRAYLRQRIEEDGDPLWRVFQEALTATRPNGEPDFRTRLMAASTLLAEAYGDTALLSPGEQVAAARDELAGMRAKRASKPR